MWNYEKRLQYPVHIKTPNAKIAKIILTQYGGPYARNLERFFYLFKCD
ncbi:MAG TPA: manganese catalase family protein [Candidatus Blautia avicola]|uniref:Manganese catalase family protein n=1 Tax=Candidatus Blautia avicola TaxID=2838483 RepID=A0A9D2TXD2_9FIRM|nr:manganese catalase family protein [Candidatus Blautia avicola]